MSAITDERLAAIDAALAVGQGTGRYLFNPSEIRAIIADLKQARAREKRMREVVEDALDDMAGVCEHTRDCRVCPALAKLRAALAETGGAK